jgi:ABC-type phosphate transport system substrate-binding protein
MTRNSKAKIAVLVLMFGMSAVGCASAASAPSGDVAIVANPDVPVDDLTLAEVRKIFKGDRQFWAGNARITLLVRAPVARERDVVLKTIYRMTEAEFRQYWISKVFRAEAVSGPKIVYSTEMTVDLVSKIPGCIGFVDAAQIPKNVKVIKTDGRLPGEPGYPLH